MSAISNQLAAVAVFQSVQDKCDGDLFFINGGSSRIIRSVHVDSIREYFLNHVLTTIRGAERWVRDSTPDDTIALLEKCLDR